jgi:hypothetical protein
MPLDEMSADNNRYIQQVQEDITAGQVVAQKNGAVFWSNDFEEFKFEGFEEIDAVSWNQLRALDFCRTQGINQYKTLELTEGGQRLAEMYDDKSIDPSISEKCGARYSRAFAESAQGNVTAFVDGSPVKSTFRCDELPALMKNKKVTSINGMGKQAWLEQQKDQWAEASGRRLEEATQKFSNGQCTKKFYEKSRVAFIDEMKENHQLVSEMEGKGAARYLPQFQNANARLDRLAATAAKHPDILESISDTKLREDMQQRVQRLEMAKQPGVMKQRQLEVDA